MFKILKKLIEYLIGFINQFCLNWKKTGIIWKKNLSEINQKIFIFPELTKKWFQLFYRKEG